MTWMSGWSKRKTIPLTGGTDGVLTNYPLSLAVTHELAMQADFSDLRFTTEDGETLIDAWLDDKTDGVSADIFVEFPFTPADGVTETKGYMYYGKSDATSDWDGDATFDASDDFEDGDTTDWTKDSGAFIIARSGVSGGNGTYVGSYEPTTSVAQAYLSFASVDEEIIEFDVKASPIDAVQMIAIEDTADDYNNSIFLRFFNDSSIEYYDGAYHALKAATADTWYHIKILTHASSSTWDCWIDGVDVGSGLGTRGTCSKFTAFSLLGALSESLYVDNIVLRQYAANPPTYTFGSEESAPAPVTPASRRFIILHEIRTFNIPRETRTLNIPFENRTLEVIA